MRNSVGLACTLAMLATAPASAELRQFGNWIVGCDNRAECTAIGTAAGNADPASPSVVIRIGVDRTSLSGFSFEIIRLPATSPDRRPIVINCVDCEDGPGTSGRPGADRIELAGQRIDVTAMRGARWLETIGKGHVISAAWSDGAQRTTIDASAFMDAWQHLARTRGTLMRQALQADLAQGLHPKGSAEDSPRAGTAIEVMPSGSPAIQSALQRCPKASDDAGYRQFALPGHATLWGLTCRTGRIATQHWFQAEGPTGKPAPLVLPDAERGSVHAGEPGFAESLFDFDFGILRARSGPAGREDCGIQRAWGWNGRTWVLLERREMPVCIGLEPSDWVRTYATP